MRSHALIRQCHRWLGIILSLAVLANFGAMAIGTPPALLVFFPLAPLALLIATGLYMFALPYLQKNSGPERG